MWQRSNGHEDLLLSERNMVAISGCGYLQTSELPVWLIEIKISCLRLLVLKLLRTEESLGWFVDSENIQKSVL